MKSLQVLTDINMPLDVIVLATLLHFSPRSLPTVSLLCYAKRYLEKGVMICSQNLPRLRVLDHTLLPYNEPEGWYIVLVISHWIPFGRILFRNFHLMNISAVIVGLQFLFCCCSVTKSCPTLCDPMGWSTPGLPVLHHLPELAQTHVHQVGDAIQPSHPLSSPSPPAFNISQHQRLF